MPPFQTRARLTLGAILFITLALPFGAAAQGSAEPMWVDRISAEHTPGRRPADLLTLTVELRVTSRGDAVSGAQVVLEIVGPAGERIPTHATSGRDGLARFSVLAPGGGPYGITVVALYHGTYFYDPNLDTHMFPGYFIPPVGIVQIAAHDFFAGVTPRIRQYTSEGLFVRDWEVELSVAAGEFETIITDLATDSQGYIYALVAGDALSADAESQCQVHKYTVYGQLINVYAADCILSNGNLTLPQIAVDSQDNLVVAGDGVWIYDSAGDELSHWQPPFPIEAVGAALDHADNLYLVGFLSDQIHKFILSGTHLLTWEFERAWGIAVDSDNQLYVTQVGGGAGPSDIEVYVFTPGGQLTGQWDSGPGTEDPLRLDFDANDRVYLIDGDYFPEGADPHVAKYTRTGGFLLGWDGLAGLGFTQTPSLFSIAVHH